MEIDTNLEDISQEESVELCGALIDYWHATDPDSYLILEFLVPIGPDIRKFDCKYWPYLFETHYKAIKGLVNALSETSQVKKVH